MRVRRFREGEVVYRHGDAAETVYVLLDGRARLTRTTAEGKDVVLGLLQAGDVCGDEHLAGATSRSATLACLGGGTLGGIDAPTFSRLLLQHPSLCFNLAARIRERLRDAEERVEDLQCRMVREPILRSLRRLAVSFGSPVDGGIALTLRLTHYDIATLSGSTRETVTGEIAALVRAGYVSKTNDGKLVVRAAAS